MVGYYDELRNGRYGHVFCGRVLCGNYRTMNQYEARKLKIYVPDMENGRKRTTRIKLNTGLEVVRTIIYKEPDPSKHRDSASFQITAPPNTDYLTEGLE